MKRAARSYQPCLMPATLSTTAPVLLDKDITLWQMLVIKSGVYMVLCVQDYQYI